MKPWLHVQGMHGMGDALHQRAVLRQLMKSHRVILEASWASMYHDLLGEDLILIRKPSSLRTQAKNVQRESEAKLFTPMTMPAARQMRVSYTGLNTLACPSKTVLEAMCVSTGTSYAEADYRLPVPAEWHTDLFKALGSLPANADRPWLVYRPLVERPEWRGSILRNAAPMAYAKVFEEIRDTFFVISVADLEPGKEWIYGPRLNADMTFHAGELNFEMLAALFEQSKVVYTSSGFGAILAPAVGTACISMTGGYEYPGCHDSAARFAPYLSIGPIVSCHCWTSACRRACDKSVDVGAANKRVRSFLSENSVQIADSTTSHEDMFLPPVPSVQRELLSGPATVLERQMRTRLW
jgi:hypothetical protein